MLISVVGEGGRTKEVDAAPLSTEAKKLFAQAILTHKKDIGAAAKAIGVPVKECIVHYYRHYKKQPGSGYRTLKALESRPHGCNGAVEEADDDSCTKCGGHGELFGCDDCDSWYCLACTGVPSKQALTSNKGPWHCSDCERRRREKQRKQQQATRKGKEKEKEKKKIVPHGQATLGAKASPTKLPKVDHKKKSKEAVEQTDIHLSSKIADSDVSHRRLSAREMKKKSSSAATAVFDHLVLWNADWWPASFVGEVPAGHKFVHADNTVTIVPHEEVVFRVKPNDPTPITGPLLTSAGSSSLVPPPFVSPPVSSPADFNGTKSCMKGHCSVARTQQEPESQVNAVEIKANADASFVDLTSPCISPVGELTSEDVAEEEEDALLEVEAEIEEELRQHSLVDDDPGANDDGEVILRSSPDLEEEEAPTFLVGTGSPEMEVWTRQDEEGPTSTSSNAQSPQAISNAATNESTDKTNTMTRLKRPAAELIDEQRSAKRTSSPHSGDSERISRTRRSVNIAHPTFSDADDVLLALDDSLVHTELRPAFIKLVVGSLLSGGGVVLGRSVKLQSPSGVRVQPSEEDVAAFDPSLGAAKVISRMHTRFSAQPETEQERAQRRQQVATFGANSLDPLVSEGGRIKIWVEDLGSTNGTLVDEEKLEPHSRVCLRPGARVQFGLPEFKLDYTVLS
jgi:hypothetical protein